MKSAIRSLLLISGLVVSLIAFPNPVKAAVAVIVHPENPVVLDAAQVKNIFLGKMLVFPDGTPAVPLDQQSGSEIRAVFVRDVLRRDEGSLNAYWARMLFSSKGRPPEVIDSVSELKKRVASNRNEIAYIDVSEVDSSVKVVFTVK